MGDRGAAEPGRRAAAGTEEKPPGDVVIRRTTAGWRVERPVEPPQSDTADDPVRPPQEDTVEELDEALALADLLAGTAVPGPRPPRPAGRLDELGRLRASVHQLEHALASRVVVEQAIGVLTERWRMPPQDAFEHLRRATRSRGVRIHDLARSVIQSCTDPDVRLPPELVLA
ncbi:MAG TPA: ANTAR domain-containing protein, partial [Mycobacteriales bacterium]|nr:ANTAR domain-containing protein [Mycobacteriales bacterium]